MTHLVELFQAAAPVRATSQTAELTEERTVAASSLSESLLGLWGTELEFAAVPCLRQLLKWELALEHAKQWRRRRTDLR